MVNITVIIKEKGLMKKYIFSSIIALIAAGFTACSEDDVKYDGPGQWNADSNYANVYFNKDSYTESIDPSAPMEYTFKLYRRVTHEYSFEKDTLGNNILTGDTIITPLPAITVKPTIIENTDSVFSISDAVFAEGDTVATITAKFPNAGVGSPYTLKVTLEGSNLVSDYSTNTQFTYTVTRVKWNSIGKGLFRDDFWFESSWEVEVMQRDDDKSYYRIMDPFGGSGEELNGSQSEYVELHVLKKGDKIGDITMADAGIVDWYRICTGFVHPNYNDVIYCLHPQNFTGDTYSSYDVYKNSCVSAYLADGKTPGQIQLAPSWYMLNTGGWNKTTTPTIFINLPGYVEKYEANIDDDFKWEKVFDGKYVSKQLGTTTNATLQKGICVTTTDDCDSIFAENYGTVYKVVSPYADGADLLFCAKGKKVLLAPGYEDPQPIGIKAMGKDVYAIINAGESSFTDGVITLNITFTDKTGKVEYGTANEQVLNLTYTEVGKGVYTYGVGQLSQNAESFYEGTENATLFRCDQVPEQYYLAPWAKSEAGLVFTVQDDNTIKFYQSTGEDYEVEGQNYGTVYFMDIEEYNPEYKSYLGKFDGDKTYKFVGAYQIPGVGGFGLISETFVLNGDASARVHKAAKKINSKDLRLKKNNRVPARFKAKKVQNTPEKKGNVRLTKAPLAL